MFFFRSPVWLSLWTWFVFKRHSVIFVAWEPLQNLFLAQGGVLVCNLGVDDNAFPPYFPTKNYFDTHCPLLLALKKRADENTSKQMVPGWSTASLGKMSPDQNSMFPVPKVAKYNRIALQENDSGFFWAPHPIIRRAFVTSFSQILCGWELVMLLGHLCRCYPSASDTLSVHIAQCAHVLTLGPILAFHRW